MNKRELIVVWVAIATHTVLSLCAMWEDIDHYGFFSAVAKSLFVTVPIGVFIVIVSALLVLTLRWRERNIPPSPHCDRKHITWQTGLFRLYMVWPVFAFAIVFLMDEWYRWGELAVQAVVVAGAPWIIHFLSKWLFRWILIPTFRWVARGFSERNEEN